MNSVADWILETTDTTGWDDIILKGPVDTFAAFNEAFKAPGDVWYSLQTETGDRECGYGFYDPVQNVLKRNTVHASLENGVFFDRTTTPSASRINLTGTTRVGCTLNAELMRTLIGALVSGSLRGVRVYGPQVETPTDARAGDFWLVP